jgi:Bacterial Ig domain
MNRRIAHAAQIGTLVLVLVLVPVAFAAKGSHAGGGHACTASAPSVSVENNWAWGQTGSWGLPGQRLAYQIRVVNNDVYCSSSSFAVGLTAPDGFSVSMPTNTINLKSTMQGYLWAYVTSPSGAPDGSYPLALTAQRAGTANSVGSSTTDYKVYSSDNVAPTLYFPNPGDGQTLSGSSYNFAVWSNDDHAVKKIDLYIDNVYETTTTCEDISYNCELYYPMSLRGLSSGQHTATFKSYDWMNTVPGVLTTTFTVN